MFGRAERRRQARAALERLEQQARGARYEADGWEAEATRARERVDQAERANRGLRQRLDDANAELRRWGLEPVTRDAPESDEHPQRYRRHSDWRTTRTGDELTELLERSAECAPENVTVELVWSDEPEPQAGPLERPKPLPDLADFEATGYAPPAPITLEDERRRALQDEERALGLRYGAGLPVAPVEGSVCPTCGEEVKAPAGTYVCGRAETASAGLVAELRSILQDTRDALRDRELNPRGLVSRTREALARLDPENPMCIVSGEVHDGLARELARCSEDAHAQLVRANANERALRVAQAEHTRREDRALERIAHLRGALGDAHAALRRRKRTELGQARAITRLVGELEAWGLRGPEPGDDVDRGLAAPPFERLQSLRAQRDTLSTHVVTLTHELAACHERNAATATLGDRQADDTIDRLRADLEAVRAERDLLIESLPPRTVEPGEPVAPDHPLRDALREARLELTDERTAREQAERSRDVAVGKRQELELDHERLQGWRTKEREVLVAFVNALADAANHDRLHADLAEPYDRAAALLEDPDA